jgi:hypothetical protein
MPRLFELEDERACELGDCVEALGVSGFDPAREDSLLHAAGWLRRLGNNPTFLGDLLVEELKNRHLASEEKSAYGPQVVMLSRPQGDFFIRAVIWPSEDERVVIASGGASFVYGLPHDHNFDFLTIGYFGPGCWSDYYEFDYEALDGWTGEPAGLRFIERARLEPGKLMQYRAHLDVHRQWPPDALSVSLNSVHASTAQGWFDQYRFDVDKDEIAGIVNGGASEAFLRIVTGLGNAEALDLAESFARSHPSHRMRLAAWDARAGIEADQAVRDEIWRQAEGSGSRLVAMEAKARRAELTEYSSLRGTEGPAAIQSHTDRPGLLCRCAPRNDEG